MQSYTMIFITINALHVSGGSSAHHQELNTLYTASGICRAFSASYRYREWVGTFELFLLLTATVSELELSSFFCFLPLPWVSWKFRAFSASYRYGEFQLTIAVRSRKSSTNTRCCVYSFEPLMMGGGTAWNIESIYSNKYHCVTLHLVGYVWIH